MGLFAPDWDFWAVAGEPVETLRRRYHVPPLAQRYRRFRVDRRSRFAFRPTIPLPWTA